VIKSPRIARRAHMIVINLILVLAGVQVVRADSPTIAPPGDPAPPPPAPSGNFLSSLKQAFKQDLDNEVVRGHFDVGSPPDSHRYYCVVDPKTGRREENGVGGQPFVRRDGMTGIKSGAVAFFSCFDAERQGLLVTSGYVLSAGTKAAMTAAAVEPKTPVIAPVPIAVTTSLESGVPASDLDQSEIRAAFDRFINGQNAHDPTVVASVLLDSSDFVWAQTSGKSIWSRGNTMKAFQEDWTGAWKLEPQSRELRIAAIAPGVAMLITPLLLTQGSAGEEPFTTPIRWAAVFVKITAGWRIGSILTTPYKEWVPIK